MSKNTMFINEQSVVNTDRIVKAILGDSYTGDTSASHTAERAVYSKEQSIINTDRIVEALKNKQKIDEQTVDIAFAAMLDDTNTTTIFKAWRKAISGIPYTRYGLLCRFGEMMTWDNESQHTVRFYNAGVSSDSAGTPLDDLAGKQAAALATENGIVSGTDWASENRQTWYVRANALSKQDGTMDIIAFEDEEGFDITGENAPVWTFGLALWFKETVTADYEIRSWRATQAEGYEPYPWDVAPDGTKRPITWHPTFCGAKNAAGALTSGAFRQVCNFTPASTGLTLARKMTAYDGLWSDCDTKWALFEFQHRHFDKENSNILEGCSNYNYQYRCAVAETGVNRVILTTAQAANFVVGSSVEVGDTGGTSAPDRGTATAYNLSKHSVVITAINTVNIGGTEYAELVLALDAPINTTTTTWVSTMPWATGSSEVVPGHLDGCRGSLTNGKYPYRLAGVEFQVGCYEIGLDPLYNVTAGSASGKFNYAVYECTDSENLSSSITSNYKNTGIVFNDMPQGWNYPKSFVATKKPILFPETLGGNTTGYYKSGFCGAFSSGVRCPWRFATLSYGGSAGLGGGTGHNSPSNSLWYGSPRLAGSGKKRGEWSQA